MGDDRAGTISRRRLIQATAAAFAATQSSLQRSPLSVAEAAADPKTTALPATMPVPAYVLSRLSQYNVKTLFGVPGATCDALFAAAAGTDVALAGNSTDFEAGYAADGYARVRGLAAVSVTYGVGMRSLLATVAGAYTERVPVVIINGGPSQEDLRIEKDLGVLFSHSTGRPGSELALFREVTEYAARAERASEVPAIVDRALTVAMTRKRPVYIEIAKDVWDGLCHAPQGSLDLTVAATGEEEKWAQAIEAKLQGAARPALLLGIEIDRYGLSDAVAAWVTRLRVPWATTLLAKSVIPEQTPGFVGVYAGEHSMPSVIQTIEGADALVAIGCVMGRQYRRLVTHAKEALIRVADDEVRVGREHAGKVALGSLIAQLGQRPWQADAAHLERARLPGLSFEQRRASLPAKALPPPIPGDTGFSYDEVLSTLSGFLDESFIAVTDTSLSMYPAAELNVHGARSFVCNAVWQAIGYSVGAAVGVGLGQARRPVVLCGDGGFQMTAQSLSTLVTHGTRAIVIVLDNGEYGIEQWLLEPRYFGSAPPPLKPYLSVRRWNYAGLAEALGLAMAKTVTTAAELGAALAEARAAHGPVLIAATLRAHDLPSELRPS